MKYLLAAALVGIATTLTQKTQPIVGEISPLFFAAIAISTWAGGLGPALLATALSGWASAYFFFDVPKGSGVFGWDDVLRLVVFLVVALLMSSLMHLRQRAERSLKVSNDRLEDRVRERTRELESTTRLVSESEERFRILMEGVADYSICMLEVSGTVISWNSGAERIYGYLEKEICGKHWRIFHTSEDRVQLKAEQQLARAEAAGRYEDEGWRVRKDGSRFWANVIITSLHDEAHTLRGFAHITRDITELKRLERQVLEISENEQQRIGHDLHDGLGQELTGLAFLSQNLGRLLSGNGVPGAAEEAMRLTSLANKAIERTRELARGLSPVELGADGFPAALRVLAEQAQKTFPMELELRLQSGVGVGDHAVAIHLYRICQEAITNAARHSKASKIWISLQEIGPNVIVEIDDDGMGIAAARSTNKGLGLHLMLYRARMIGAALSVENRPGGGTAVRCVFQNLTEENSMRNWSAGVS